MLTEDVYNGHFKALEGLISIHPNLIELVASGNTKPAKVQANTRILGKEFSGVNSRDKIGHVRRKMEDEKCDCYVMTGLDEIAYLLNSTHSLWISVNGSSGR
jgi:Creatinase/Prolidase N-terminal domain